MSSLGHDLYSLLEMMVDHPEDLYVEEFPLQRGPGGSLFEVQVAPGDAGKIIGRQGRTIRALRNLLELRGLKDGQRYELEVVDD